MQFLDAQINIFLHMEHLPIEGSWNGPHLGDISFDLLQRTQQFLKPAEPSGSAFSQTGQACEVSSNE